MSEELAVDKLKWDMTEEDIKHFFITPAVETAGWNTPSLVRMERRITDGRIDLRGNVCVRKEAKKADYVLYKQYPEIPVAIVEAKDNKHLISDGMSQAKEYAEMLSVPFAYSSNGDGFQEYDFNTGIERTLALSEFPSPDELLARFEKEANGGQGITAEETKLLTQPCCSGQKINEPRYYQLNAINKTLSAIAKGQKRILLVMATGTGKTCTAFQIVWRLLKSGAKKKILYLADRNILVDQSKDQDFKPLKKVTHKVNYANDSKEELSSYQLYFSLYQQLFGENNEERFKDMFASDFFDLVIVDECHRGSADEDSKWKKILEYFSSATQIGMTATPKETKYVSNIDYFGDPVYVYSLKQGIEDGFLAPFKVINVKLSTDDGWRPYKGQLDYFGREIEDRIYTVSDFDTNIVLEDRINTVAQEITAYLKKTGRMQKTIVFCPTEAAAERMRVALVNCNSDKMKENPDYVVRITGSDNYGKSKLDYFISPNEQYPVIATTSQLLSTGVDCKTVKLIVLDKMIGSMTEFKQTVGRGTRIREDKGKMFFKLMDFRRVTRLFSDPDWDGPIEQDDEYGQKKDRAGAEDEQGEQNTADLPKIPREIPYVDVTGCPVCVLGKEAKIYDTDGKLLRTENIMDYTRTNIKGKFGTLEHFITQWSKEEKKKAIADLLRREHGIDLEDLKQRKNMENVDDFDFICHVAYDAKPLTRRERANNVKKRDFLNKYQGVARQVLEALLDRYMNIGINEIESPEILKINPFADFGKPSKIAGYFGGVEGYKKAVSELEQEIYKAG